MIKIYPENSFLIFKHILLFNTERDGMESDYKFSPLLCKTNMIVNAQIQITCMLSIITPEMKMWPSYSTCTLGQ